MTITRPALLFLLALVPAIGFLGLWGRFSRRGRPLSPGVVASMVLRSLVLVLLIVSLAGPRTGRTDDGIRVAFAIDTSDSVTDAALAAATTAVEEAMAGSSESAAVVSFGGTAAIERDQAAGWTEASISGATGRGATNIAEGIYRSLEVLPDGGTRRIVLFSDGNANRGNVDAAVRAAAAAGVEIDTVPVSAAPSDQEVLVQSVSAPRSVDVGSYYAVRAVVRAAVTTNTEVLLFRNEELIATQRPRLPEGDSIVEFETSEEEEGWYRYEVFVRSAADRLPQNNSGSTYVQVEGRPTVLYVSKNGDPSLPFLEALATQGFIVRATDAAGIPDNLTDLLTNDAVVLDNVPAYDLSVRKMEVLEDYVQGTGGGLLMIGGDAAFGAGGYFRTPVERLLPVDMDITSSMRIPSLAMVFVIDKSGSMGNTEVGGTSKLDLVKEAVLSSVEIMNPFYNVGLLAFDADVEWTVPLTPAGEQERIVELLASLESGGGTILDAALEEALAVLSGTRASVKHLVVLSDGLASEAEFEPIVARLADANITVSTVSIGSNANRPLMEDIARWGDGRHYHTATTREIPRIFTSETTIVSRNLIVEEVFFPTISYPSPITAGFDEAELPPLRGFVLTYPKEGANQPLSGTGENPVLATWRYGLGRTAAFTSDVRGRWGRDWVTWDGFPRFVGQLMRWIERPAGNEGISIEFEPSATDHQRVTASIEVRNEAGEYVSGVQVVARVLGPSGEPYDVNVRHTAPGAYEMDLVVDEAGDYFVTIRDSDGDRGIGPYTAVYTVPYSSEYSGLSPNYPLLESIAARTGGIVSTPQDIAPFREGSGVNRGTRDLWPLLSLLALMLFLAELLVVYVLIPNGVFNRLAHMLKRAESSKPGHSYEDVRREILESYEREKERKKDLRTWFRVQRGTSASDRRVAKK